MSLFFAFICVFICVFITLLMNIQADIFVVAGMRCDPMFSSVCMVI